MSNPNPERDERVPSQINLSLCSACHAVSVGWNNCPHCGAEDWQDVGVYALVDNEAATDAATRMRDRCVEKVEAWIANLSRTGIATEQSTREISILNDLRREIQSLTLEQGEQEKP